MEMLNKFRPVLGLSKTNKDRIKHDLMKHITITPQEKPETTVPSALSILSSPKFVLAVVLVLFFIGAGTTVYGSRHSLPGEPLHKVKQAIEKARLETAITDYQASSIEAEIANTRIDELAKLEELQQLDAIANAETEAATSTSQAVKHLGEVEKQLAEKGNIEAAKKVKTRIEELNKKAYQRGIMFGNEDSKNDNNYNPQVRGAHLEKDDDGNNSREDGHEDRTYFLDDNKDDNWDSFQRQVPN